MRLSENDLYDLHEQMYLKHYSEAKFQQINTKIYTNFKSGT